MIDPKLLRTDLPKVAEALRKKHYELDAALFTRLDTDRKERQIKAEGLQAERNQYSKSIGALIGAAKAKGDDIEPLKAQGEALKHAFLEAEESLQAVQSKIESLLLEMPNIPDGSVPNGKSESDNLETRRWGEPPTFTFSPLDHVDLGVTLGGLDFDRGAKITGSRFLQMRGQIALLHRALGQFMLNTHITEHGYEEVYTPYIVNRESLLGTGQLPKFEADLFKLDDEREYYLIPTAEVPVTNIFRNEIIDELPIKFVCHTPCFRSEAGSYGRDTRGMIRQHQFDKVEMVQFVEAKKSWAALDDLTTHAQNILEKLKLPYRRVTLCGGDLGFSSAKTYDLEVWLPSQSTYREISSCSNFTDFQARRMKTRYRNASSGQVEHIHTVNGSGLAVGRTLVAIMENYQREDGSLQVPDVLQPYMNGLRVIT